MRRCSRKYKEYIAEATTRARTERPRTEKTTRTHTESQHGIRRTRRAHVPRTRHCTPSSPADHRRSSGAAQTSLTNPLSLRIERLIPSPPRCIYPDSAHPARAHPTNETGGRASLPASPWHIASHLAERRARGSEGRQQRRLDRQRKVCRPGAAAVEWASRGRSERRAVGVGGGPGEVDAGRRTTHERLLVL